MWRNHLFTILAGLCPEGDTHPKLPNLIEGI